MEPVQRLSDPAEFALVYPPAEESTAWWARWVGRRSGFVHVEAWWRLGEIDGLEWWCAIRPYHDYLAAEMVRGPPESIEGARVQRVVAARRRGTPLFPAGLKTCVSVVKAALGIRAAWIITPQQLYDYVERRNGYV